MKFFIIGFLTTFAMLVGTDKIVKEIKRRETQ